MAGRRVPRLNEQLRREISELLMREVRDPRVAGVTVTEVRATADLQHARVFVAVPTDADVDAALAGLAAATPFMRGAIGRRLQIRRVPELQFEVDATLEHALRIERLLGEVRTTPSSGAGMGDTDGADRPAEADDGA